MPKRSKFRRRLYNVVDTVIVVICLPFYAVAFPIFTLSEMRKAKELAKRHCPHCGEVMTGLNRRTFECMGVRHYLTANVRVDREHMPQTKFQCPKCGQHSCIDAKWRFTSCNHADHIYDRGQVES